jgi:hypothetical protein
MVTAFFFLLFWYSVRQQAQDSWSVGGHLTRNITTAVAVPTEVHTIFSMGSKPKTNMVLYHARLGPVFIHS